jgi:hypothetical protein
LSDELSSEMSQSPYLTLAYSEICRSYQALHDFRMKLLSLLPIASIVGLLALGKSLPSSSPGTLQPEAVGYIGIFSGLFTLGLFACELRALLLCHDYSTTGAAMEARMNIDGQFTYCNEMRPFKCYFGPVKRPLARLVNTENTSCFLYSLVFASWSFVGIHYATGMEVHNCAYWAGGLGLALAVVVSGFFHRLTTVSGMPSDGGTGMPVRAVVE